VICDVRYYLGNVCIFEGILHIFAHEIRCFPYFIRPFNGVELQCLMVKFGASFNNWFLKWFIARYLIFFGIVAMESLLEHIDVIYAAILQDRILSYSDKVGDCLIWQKSISSNGYPQLKVTIKTWGSRPVPVHRLHYMLHHKQHIAYDEENEISHLCHNPLCIEINHLSLEPHSINLERKECKITGSCRKHNNFPDCVICKSYVIIVKDLPYFFYIFVNMFLIP